MLALGILLIVLPILLTLRYGMGRGGIWAPEALRLYRKYGTPARVGLVALNIANPVALVAGFLILTKP